MNREKAKDILPFIQAYADGKLIKCNGEIAIQPDFSAPATSYEISEPENKWMGTGWVKNKENGRILKIIGYNEKENNKYFIDQWRTEFEMEANYTPCESPIGVKF